MSTTEEGKLPRVQAAYVILCNRHTVESVSYTHLTLPTTTRV